MTLTIEEFRSDPERVRAAKQLLADPLLVEMLAVLRNNGPEFRKQPNGMTPTDAAVRLGHISGYAEHHQHFEELGERLPVPGRLPPPSYTEEEREQQE